MIYEISRRANSHKDYCEDAHFVLDFPSMVIFGAFDGCSTGKDTYFASALLARCVKKTFIDHYELAKGLYNMQSYAGIDSATINTILHSACLTFRTLAVILNSTELELLTTCVISVYIKSKKKLLYKFLGDGSLYWMKDEKLHVKTINFPGNKPDYPAYHYADGLFGWITSQPGGIIEDIEEFSLCTDGIDSIKCHNKDIILPKEHIEGYLLEDKTLCTSSKMLHRKVNILQQSGVVFDDDLTILRYIP